MLGPQRVGASDRVGWGSAQTGKEDLYTLCCHSALDCSETPVGFSHHLRAVAATAGVSAGCQILDTFVLGGHSSDSASAPLLRRIMTRCGLSQGSVLGTRPRLGRRGICSPLSRREGGRISLPLLMCELMASLLSMVVHVVVLESSYSTR